VRTPIRAICRREVGLGLALAGLTPIEAATGDDAAAAIARLASEPARGGVILIDAALYRALPASVRRQIRRDGAPILMPLPGPALGAAARAPEEELLDILRRAVGYRVRLR